MGGVKMITKKTREIVYNKYNGHCAYCGCEIEMKDMQVDHIVPKYRNNEMWHKGKIGTDDISNLNPSCRMCNYYKGMSRIDAFRVRLKNSLMFNLQKEPRFRLAQKYGMVKIEEWDEKFYYEKKEEQI